MLKGRDSKPENTVSKPFKKAKKLITKSLNSRNNETDLKNDTGAVSYIGKSGTQSNNSEKNIQNSAGANIGKNGIQNSTGVNSGSGKENNSGNNANAANESCNFSGADSSSKTISTSIKQNIERLKSIFAEDETIIVHRFKNSHAASVNCCLFCINGMVDQTIINQFIIQPIINFTGFDANTNANNNIIDTLRSQVIQSNSITESKVINELVQAILNGDTVLFVEWANKALIISTVGWDKRAVEKPDSENVLRGPREGFNESIWTNIALIRRRLKTPDLKFRFMTIGSKSNTSICICYLKGVAHEKILNELIKRLNEINIDGVLDTGYILEMIKDSPYSPFMTIGSTERPDVVAAKLLEGRIAVIMDGTCFALTLPFVFIENFQANEDYYNLFYFASVNRLIRIIGFFITISLPALYVALTTFHQEAIPTPLLLGISSARQQVPFPTVAEAFILLLIFEVLREAGTRMPQAIGQAVSIVGALVLGEASVEARLISAPMIIIVGVTGITGLLLPKMKGAIIPLRFTLLLFASIIGLYGYMFSIIGMLIHLCSIRSFGVPYLLNIDLLNPADIKDTAIRAPWWFQNKRPRFIAKGNRIRQNTKASGKGGVK